MSVRLADAISLIPGFTGDYLAGLRQVFLVDVHRGLVGRAHWTEELPVWPLLQALAAGRPMEPHVHLVDTVEEAVQVVLDTLSRRGDG